VIIRVLLAAFLASSLHVATAWGQPQITLSTTVVLPGERVVVRVMGGPGEFFAIIGSSVNGGFHGAAGRGRSGGASGPARTCGCDERARPDALGPRPGELFRPGARAMRRG
jgi:hypothetical protein